LIRWKAAFRIREGGTMGDMLYLLGTIGFFALMVGYVEGSAELGRAANPETQGGDRDR